jgi:hypothetical protein
MPKVIGIGNAEAQQSFIIANKRYLAEWELLKPLIEKVFLNRVILPPSDEELASLADLPEDDPKVLAVDGKHFANLVVYNLGRIAVDDFSELMVLAGNGWGIGAMKALRSMYEHVVTAAYISRNPEKSIAFATSLWTYRAKALERMLLLDPTVKDRIPPETLELIEREAKKAKDKKNRSNCKKCGHEILDDAWTQKPLDAMAASVGKVLEPLYLPCYLEPMSHIHATGAGVNARITHGEGQYLYRLDTTSEATTALHFGHSLTIQNLVYQNEYFKYGLDAEIEVRWKAIDTVWQQEDSTQRPAN